MNFTFDPPDSAGVEHAVRLLKEKLGACGEHHGLPSVEDILASEGARRTGAITLSTTAPETPETSPAHARRMAGERHDLNAFVRVFSAEESASMAGADTNAAGALRDLPFAFKDVFFAHGHRPGAGTPYRFRSPDVEQAPLLSCLCAAGAVAVGATKLDPFSYSTTGENPFHDAPVNPHDPALLVGGSSSGSAVAVSAGIVPFAIGTDTGGSIRIPAAFCGVWGWKPTNGLLDASGLVPLSSSHDCPAILAANGRLLRRVAEAVIARTAPARRGTVEVLRLGVAKSLFAASAPAAGEALDRFLTLSDGDGAVSIAPPDLALCNSIATIITGYEAARFLRPVFDEAPDAFTGNVRQRLAIGAALNRRDYEAAQHIRARLTADFLAGPLAECDLIVSPVTPRSAYRRDELNGPPEAVRQLTLELLEFNRWVNSFGLPAVAIPLRLPGTGQMAAVQIIGRPHADLDLLRFLEALPL